MILLAYIFLIVFWIIESRRGEKGTNTYLIVTSTAFFLLVGLRNMAIYGDSLGYVVGFESMESKSVDEVLLRWTKDPIFYLISKLIGSLCNYNYTIWFLIISASYFIPLFFLLKRYSANIMQSWVAWIFVGLLFFVMAGLRQTVSMGLVMTAFLMLMKKKDIAFFLIMIAAYLLHGASFIALLIYPVVRFKWEFTRKSLWAYIILTIIGIGFGTTIMPNVTELLGEQDKRFIEYGQGMKGATYTYFIQQLLLVLPSIYLLRNKWREKHISIFAHISMISLLMVAMSPAIAEMFRASMFFSWAILILFPMAMKEIAVKQPIVPVIFISLMTIYLLFINGSLLNEYFFWFEDTTLYINNTFMSLDEYI